MSKNVRVPLSTALLVSESLSDRLAEIGLRRGSDFEVCGSIRRRCPTVGDIDVAIVDSLLAEGQSQISSLLVDPYIAAKSGILKSGIFEGMKVEFYPAPSSGWGAMLLFATGSPKFNIFCRVKAKESGWKLSQYGLFAPNEELVCRCDEELSILNQLGISQFIDPTKREV
jgi:DNA polymerase (family 10)